MNAMPLRSERASVGHVQRGDVMASVKMIKMPKFRDERGWFAETYNRSALETQGVFGDFVQDNCSYSSRPGTLRGLHFQAPPHAQAKLVRCVRGKIWDVAVDVRKDSPTFGRSVSAILSAENGDQLYVPVGFAHGFITLEPDTEVAYKVSDFYSPASDAGLRWNDPVLGLPWPLPPNTAPTLSAKDAALPLLAGFDSPFEFDGVPLPDSIS
jgi:dTDP-4-dehydrorhamnose 3,5-epimerase